MRRKTQRMLDTLNANIDRLTVRVAELELENIALRTVADVQEQRINELESELDALRFAYDMK
jgi:hypothetical protein